ncbi:MAG: hypothetical protein ABW199_01065 [Caulobacterales bacterium]
MKKLIYSLRYRDGRWSILLRDKTRLFEFDDRADALRRLDEVVAVGSRGDDIEVQIYDERDTLISRQSSEDYEI